MWYIFSSSFRKLLSFLPFGISSVNLRLPLRSSSVVIRILRFYIRVRFSLILNLLTFAVLMGLIFGLRYLIPIAISSMAVD